MKKIKFIAVLFFAVFTACQSATTSNTNAISRPESYSTTADLITANKSVVEGGGMGSGTGGGGGGGGREKPLTQKISLEQSEQTVTAPTAIERKIIRNADLTLEANAPEEAQNKIAAIAESKGGFVIESSQSASDTQAATRDTVTMTVRVPAVKFNETLDEIRQTSSRVIVETVKGQDVTEEFIDIEARLKTQKALEAQFLEIMKRSNSVEDALNVQREIADVRTEIEKVEGRKHFLENQASLSTIKIKLQTPIAFAGNSSGFFNQLGESISNGINGAMSFVLILVTALIALVPFLLFIALPVYLLIRYFLRKNRKQKLAGEIAREEIKNQ